MSNVDLKIGHRTSYQLYKVYLSLQIREAFLSGFETFDRFHCRKLAKYEYEDLSFL